MKTILLAVACLVAGSSVAACSHTVEGEGDGASTRSAREAQLLPEAGDACRCTSPAGQIPPNGCCAGGLLCGDATGMPGPVSCDSLGCWRAGICVESPFSEMPSSSGSSGSSDFREPPPDECSPFKRNNDTCPPGKECHLVRDHWGCV